jgi:hypothetical protein
MKFISILSILSISFAASAVILEGVLEEREAVRIPNPFTLYST